MKNLNLNSKEKDEYLEWEIEYATGNLKPEEKTIDLVELTKQKIINRYKRNYINIEKIYEIGYQKILNEGIKEKNLNKCGLKIINRYNFNNTKRTIVEKIIFAELRLNIKIYAYYEDKDEYGVDRHYLLFEYNDPKKQTEEINVLYWLQDEIESYFDFWWFKGTAKLEIFNYSSQDKQEISHIKLIKQN